MRQETPFRRWELGAVLLIVCIALAARLFLYIDFRNTIHFDLTQFDELDNHTWHVFGQRVADGDWLQTQPFLPTPSWALKIAPEEQWLEWYGSGTRFYDAPLYGYAVGIVYSVFGADPDYVRIFQLAAGVLRAVLVYLVARLLFTPVVALISLLLSAIYSPLLYYELCVLSVSTRTLLNVATLLSLVVALRGRGRLAWMGVGLLSGLELLAGGTLHFLVPVAALALQQVSRYRKLRQALMLLAGMSLALSPLICRNLYLGDPPLAISTRGAVDFIRGNLDEGILAGESGYYMPASTGEILEKTGHRPLATVLAVLEAHLDDPLGYVGLILRKAAEFWRTYEIPNNTDYHIYRHAFAVLRLPFSGFGFVCPLAVLGAILAFHERRRLFPLYGYIAVIFVSVTAFVVLARLRLPVVPHLIVFASYGLYRLAEAVQRRRWQDLALGLMLSGGIWLLITVPAEALRSRADADAYIYFFNEYSDESSVHSDAIRDFDAVEAARKTLYEVKKSYDTGRFEECIEPLERVLMKFPGLLFTRYALARSHFEIYLRDRSRVEHLAAAKKEIAEVLSRNPNATYARDLEKTIEAMEAAERDSPSPSTADGET